MTVSAPVLVLVPTPAPVPAPAPVPVLALKRESNPQPEPNLKSKLKPKLEPRLVLVLESVPELKPALVSERKSVRQPEPLGEATLVYAPAALQPVQGGMAMESEGDDLYDDDDFDDDTDGDRRGDAGSYFTYGGDAGGNSESDGSRGHEGADCRSDGNGDDDGSANGGYASDAHPRQTAGSITAAGSHQPVPKSPPAAPEPPVLASAPEVIQAAAAEGKVSASDTADGSAFDFDGWVALMGKTEAQFPLSAQEPQPLARAVFNSDEEDMLAMVIPLNEAANALD
jgi:hypothetical protein